MYRTWSESLTHSNPFLHRLLSISFVLTVVVSITLLHVSEQPSLVLASNAVHLGVLLHGILLPCDFDLGLKIRLDLIQRSARCEQVCLLVAEHDAVLEPLYLEHDGPGEVERAYV